MGETTFRWALGESWDVVEVVRSLSQAVGLLTTEVDELRSVQKIVSERLTAQEARLQVLEGTAAPRPLVTVGDLVPPPHQVAGGFIAESEAVDAVSDAVGSAVSAPLTTTTAASKAAWSESVVRQK